MKKGICTIIKVAVWVWIALSAPEVSGQSDTGISGPDAVCPGALQEYCTPAIPGIKFHWSISGDATITDLSDEPCITVAASATACNGSFLLRLRLERPGGDTISERMVLVQDKTAPVIACPKDITVSCDEQLPSPDVSAMTVSDNCNGTIIRNFVSGVVYDKTCPNRYQVTRTYKATDACGNTTTCSQHVAVYDEVSPDITCPPNTTVSCSDPALLVDLFYVFTADNCGGNTQKTHLGDQVKSLAKPDHFLLSRTFLATDLCGQTDICTQLIEVEDTEGPAIACPAHLTVACPGDVPAVDLAKVSASDNCIVPVLKTHTGDVVSNQICGNRFLLTRTYQAADICGHTASCSQQILVNDLTPPTITCPPNTTVTCANQALTVDLGVVTVSDNCSAVTKSLVKDVITNKVCDNNFKLTRSFKVEDGCGYMATCSYTIRVLNQTTAPIVCAPNITVSCAGEVPAPNSTSSFASDNCGGALTQATWLGDLVTNKTCDNRYQISRSYRATDACGNTGVCVQKIAVQDMTPPAITCPANVTVSCAAQVPVATSDAVTVLDNCTSGKPAVYLSEAVSNNACAGRYLLSRTYKAKDKCGNEGSCIQLILVDDQIPPTVSCPASITVNCAGLVPPANPAGITAADNCTGLVTKQFSGDWISDNVCANRYVVNRAYEAADACGNKASCTQKITVSDLKPPTISCPGAVTVSSTNQVPAINLSAVTAGADNCGGAATKSHLTDLVSNQVCAERYLLTRVYQAADVCGNTATCSQKITVQDQTPPSGQCPKSITVSCADDIPCSVGDPQFDGLIQQLQSLYTDNAGAEEHIMVDSLLPVQECSAGNFTFSRTVRYRISDDCGNSTLCSVQYSGACYCTRTEALWGDPAGKIDGLTTTKIIDSLLRQGWITIGNNAGCGWTISTAPCIFKALPANGPSAPFHPDSLPDCNGQLENALVGQLITLHLNLRYNQTFRGLDLGQLPLAGSCFLDAAQIKALGLPSGATVQDLVAMANTYLLSFCNDTTYSSGYGIRLTNILSTLNGHWDNCANNNPCNPGPGLTDDPGSAAERQNEPNTPVPGAGELFLYPNPATSVLQLSFWPDAPAENRIRIFDAEGKLVFTRSIVTGAGVHIENIDLTGWKQGLYSLVLTGNNRLATKRFAVLR